MLLLTCLPVYWYRNKRLVQRSSLFVSGSRSFGQQMPWFWVPMMAVFGTRIRSSISKAMTMWNCERCCVQYRWEHAVLWRGKAATEIILWNLTQLHKRFSPNGPRDLIVSFVRLTRTGEWVGNIRARVSKTNAFVCEMWFEMETNGRWTHLIIQNSCQKNESSSELI